MHLTESLDPATLLMVGAPGGAWFQRQIYGPGYRLAVRAPAGVLVVRKAEPRCFHIAADAAGAVAGPHMSASAAREVMRDPVIAVAESGVLLGVVRAGALDDLHGDLMLRDVMHPPVSVGATEPIETIAEVRKYFGGGPIPVIDDAGTIVGVVPAAASRAAAYDDAIPFLPR